MTVKRKRADTQHPKAVPKMRVAMTVISQGGEPSRPLPTLAESTQRGQASPKCLAEHLGEVPKMKSLLGA
jgi:hypothetical protein